MKQGGARPEVGRSRQRTSHSSLVSAWEAADPGQRSRLVASIFDQLEAELLPEGRIRVVAVPRSAWKPLFEGLVMERETGLTDPGANRRVEFVYRFASGQSTGFAADSEAVKNG